MSHPAILSPTLARRRNYNATASFVGQRKAPRRDQTETRHEPDERVEAELQPKLARHADHNCVSRSQSFRKSRRSAGLPLWSFLQGGFGVCRYEEGVFFGSKVKR